MDLSKLRIDRFKIEIKTTGEDYGFSCEFKKGLNVIRGDNSSGKSTLVNSIIYALGMEELIGGQGIKSLPYTLKDYLLSPSGKRCEIVSSFVYLEICNYKGEKVVIKRAVKSKNKEVKLAEIILGPYLSNPEVEYIVKPTYIHDSGSAKNKDAGFFAFMENFLGISLPMVSKSSGGESKLYLQCIFSALIVEQKRGWTDYLANIPYFALRESKLKVVQYLLGLDVFENDRKRESILCDIADLNKRWGDEFSHLKLISDNENLTINGVSSIPDDHLDSKLVVFSKFHDGKEISISEYKSYLSNKLVELNSKSVLEEKDGGVFDSYELEKQSLGELVSSIEDVSSEISLCRSRVKAHNDNLASIMDDLSKNKVALKLKKFGAEQSLEVATDQCPSCHQKIDDSLFFPDHGMLTMGLEENIDYLEKQKLMVSRYVKGLNNQIDELKSKHSSLSSSISAKRALVLSLRKDLVSTDSIKESDIRQKVYAEDSLSRIKSFQSRASELVDSICLISNELSDKKKELALVPKKTSRDDLKKINYLENSFKGLARVFGYRSASIDDIEINKDTLLPYLSGIELREVQSDKNAKKDLKSDSSASDFVRLIWAYLISIYRVSNSRVGNHPGVLVLDEPAQHSMAVEHVKELLNVCSHESNLQTIIAASFDQRDDIYYDSVAGLNHHLIKLPSKLLEPIVQ